MRVSNPRSIASLISLTACIACFSFGQVTQPAGNGSQSHVSPALPGREPKTKLESSENPLKVVCTGDQLTISANNSTLASILAEVQKCISEPIVIPEGAGNDRFFDTIGPGPIRKVLASLLDATGLNFVIESSDSDPQNIQTVVLMARSETATTDTAADHALTPARRAYLQMLQNSRLETQSHNDSSAAAAESESGATDQPPAQQPQNQANTVSQEPPADPPSANAASEAPPTSSAGSTASAPSSSPDSAPVDNQITNMEQMFEQRRQMIRNSASPPQ